MQLNKSCKLVEQYLAYLVTIKGRSKNTILEYRLYLLQFFHFVDLSQSQEHMDFQYVNIEFIDSITLGDMYAFLAYCQDILHLSPGTRTRKIVSILQFWKYLKTKAHLINNNIAEELETPKQPKRIVRCLTLEESVRLLIESSSSSARDNCIIQSITKWLSVRNSITVNTNALFISRNGGRLTTRAIQNIVKKHIVAAGINPEGLSTHKLRHTSATLMYKYGHVDIRSLQQILGHESIATTEIYTHVDERQLQAAVNSNPLAMMFS